MDKPFAITLDVGSSLANKTGAWRTERPLYVDRLPPCNHACPAGENIQSWLYHAESGDYQAAWRALTEDNPLPAIMGRVCYHPCEGACNRGQIDEAVGRRHSDAPVHVQLLDHPGEAQEHAIAGGHDLSDALRRPLGHHLEGVAGDVPCGEQPRHHGRFAVLSLGQELEHRGLQICCERALQNGARQVFERLARGLVELWVCVAHKGADQRHDGLWLQPRSDATRGHHSHRGGSARPQYALGRSRQALGVDHAARVCAGIVHPSHPELPGVAVNRAPWPAYGSKRPSLAAC